MQTDLFNRAKTFRDQNTRAIDSYEEFKKQIDEPGGFFMAHWDGDAATEARLQEETKATIRCIPLDAKKESGKCMITGKPSERRVLIAKAY
jgi:prolyl-tRNA synthetase